MKKKHMFIHFEDAIGRNEFTSKFNFICINTFYYYYTKIIPPKKRAVDLTSDLICIIRYDSLIKGE